MMNGETNEKQEWQTPESVDLDIDKTAGGPTPHVTELTGDSVS